MPLASIVVKLLGLRVRQVDLGEGTVMLPPGVTKTKEPRLVAMTPAIRELLVACCTGKQPDDYVLTRQDKAGRQLPVKDFRGKWYKVTAAAGLAGLRIHDFRRSAARNLRRAGVSEGMVMQTGGWKTRAVFERYNIKNLRDQQEAMAALGQQRRAQQRKAKVSIKALSQMETRVGGETRKPQ